MEFLKKDIGPLPVWAWGLVIVAGVGIGYFIMKSQNSAAAPATDTGPAVTLPANTDSGGGATSGGGTTTPDTSQFVTNDQLQQAIAGINQALGSNNVATNASTASGTAPNLVPSASPSPAGSTASSHTPADNLGKIRGYLAGLHCTTSVNQVGKPGTAESGYVVSGVCVVASALRELFGAGWSVTKCGNTFLVKGPNAKKLKFDKNCHVVGAD